MELNCSDTETGTVGPDSIATVGKENSEQLIIAIVGLPYRNYAHYVYIGVLSHMWDSYRQIAIILIY